MRADRRAVAVALGASLATHLAAMSALSGLPGGVRLYEVALVEPRPDAALSRAEPPSEGRDARDRAPEPTTGAPASSENVDTRSRGGGGEPTGAAEFITLVTRSDDLTLVGRIANATDANQMQRIRTARDRATPWQGRATPSPEEAPFLASGEGERRERRTPSPNEPARGERTNEARTAAGDEHGGNAANAGALAEPVPAGSDIEGRARAHAGAGVSNGTGPAVTARANVAHARPALDRGLPTVPAEVIYELPRDTVDSEALTARLSQSFVDTSRRAARQAGPGTGGAGGPGDPGSGAATGAGGRSTPYSPGTGTDGTLDLSAGRYRTFYLALQREVERHLSFPRERALNLDQGHAVFRITLRRDGALARAPQLVRSTGFADLDSASRAAIERARFEALPSDLSPDASSVTIRISVHSRNPLQ